MRKDKKGIVIDIKNIETKGNKTIDEGEEISREGRETVEELGKMNLGIEEQDKKGGYETVKENIEKETTKAYQEKVEKKAEEINNTACDIRNQTNRESEKLEKNIDHLSAIENVNEIGRKYAAEGIGVFNVSIKEYEEMGKKAEQAAENTKNKTAILKKAFKDSFDRLK